MRVALLAGLILCGLTFERASDLNLAVTSASTKPDAAEQRPQEFEVRCHAPGVIVCQGFDSPVIGVPASWPAAGLYPAWDKALRGTLLLEKAPCDSRFPRTQARTRQGIGDSPSAGTLEKGLHSTFNFGNGSLRK